MRLLERAVRHQVFVGREVGFRFVEEVLPQAVLHRLVVSQKWVFCTYEAMH